MSTVISAVSTMRVAFAALFIVQFIGLPLAGAAHTKPKRIHPENRVEASAEISILNEWCIQRYEVQKTVRMSGELKVNAYFQT